MLFSGKGVIKVCDFGSATTEAIYPDDSWLALQRSMAEEEVSVSIHTCNYPAIKFGKISQKVIKCHKLQIFSLIVINILIFVY